MQGFEPHLNNPVKQRRQTQCVFIFGKQQIVQMKQYDMKMTMKTQSATKGIVEMLLWIGRSPAVMVLQVDPGKLCQAVRVL